jgi:hypothetical protein
MTNSLSKNYGFHDIISKQCFYNHDCRRFEPGGPWTDE